jgi:dihydroorotate dehydrogenase electron transfer subunit
MHEMTKSRTFRATVIGNASLNTEHYLLTLDPLAPTQQPKPGQFYMVAAGQFPEPLLKRPFCFLKQSPSGSILILYRVTGKGTALLRDMRQGTTLDLIGPLGNGWPEHEGGYTPVIVAGGTGIASVFPLIESSNKESIVVYGTRSIDDRILYNELSISTQNLYTCTDDGSCGTQGNVLDMLHDIEIPTKSIIYTCGPEVMTRAVAEFAQERGIKGYVSLEEHMACGIGACMGCVCKTPDGYKRVCKEGPVFPLSEVM